MQTPEEIFFGYLEAVFFSSLLAFAIFYEILADKCEKTKKPRGCFLYWGDFSLWTLKVFLPLLCTFILVCIAKENQASFLNAKRNNYTFWSSPPPPVLASGTYSFIQPKLPTL